jgi:hypothetical protein
MRSTSSASEQAGLQLREALLTLGGLTGLRFLCLKIVDDILTQGDLDTLSNLR